MNFRIHYDQSRSFPQLYAAIEALIERKLRPRERELVALAQLATDSDGWRNFAIQLEEPRDVAINLELMREYGLCGGSKCDTASDELMRQSISHTPTPESAAEDLILSALSTHGTPRLTMPEDASPTYIVNNSSWISIGTPITAPGSVVYYSGTAMPIPHTIPADVGDISLSNWRRWQDDEST